MEYRPIGVFDSGYGGLTVLKSLEEKLPQYDFLYLGDNARTPYGSRSFETIYEYTLEAVKYLFNKGCSLIILACNTASAKALRTIQQNDLPKLFPEKRVLGVIRPTAEIISSISSTKNVGVLGTIGTVKSESYVLEIKKQDPDLVVVQQACPMWVPLIEAGELNNEGSSYFVRKYLNELLSKNEKIDTILLGCTHYPLLINELNKIITPNISVLSQGPIVADSLVDYLKRHPEIEVNCSKKGKINFLTTDDTDNFNDKAVQFFGQKISSKKVHL